MIARNMDDANGLASLLAIFNVVSLFKVSDCSFCAQNKFPMTFLIFIVV